MIKSSFKKSAFLLHSAIPGFAAAWLTGSCVPVFMLHRFDHPERGISGADIGFLRECLEFFRKNNYQALTLESLADSIRERRPVPPKSAVFTLDDGFIDQYEIAGPLFEEYDVPLTIFLITDFIDRKLWPWDDQLSYLFEQAAAGKYECGIGGQKINIELTDVNSRISEKVRLREFVKTVSNSRLYPELEQLYSRMNVPMAEEIPEAYLPMTWDDARDLSSGIHRIAAHTASHRILSKLEDRESEMEIRTSIQRINEEIPGASPVFAYPTGRARDFGKREMEFLDKAGISATVSTEPGSILLDQPENLQVQSLPRFSMPVTLPDFVQYLSWIEVVKDKIRNMAN